MMTHLFFQKVYRGLRPDCRAGRRAFGAGDRGARFDGTAIHEGRRSWTIPTTHKIGEQRSLSGIAQYPGKQMGSDPTPVG